MLRISLNKPKALHRVKKMMSSSVLNDEIMIMVFISYGIIFVLRDLIYSQLLISRDHAIGHL